MTPGAVPLVCAVLALATSGTAVAVSLESRGWQTSSLVRMSDQEPLASVAREHDPSFEFVPITSHYDGVYFYAIALDPLGRGAASEAIRADRGPYRYGHAGYGWMAWLASAGRPSAVPTAMLVLALAGIALGAWTASSLARALGVTPWAGLAVAFNPGIVYAATVLTSEAVGVGLLMLGLLLWVRGRRGFAAAVLAAACLTKEPFLLVPAAIGLWELVHRFRARRWGCLSDPELWKRAGLLLIGPALFGVWYLFLIARFDVVPHSLVEDLTQWPFVGWIDSIADAARIGLGTDAGVATFDRVQIMTASVALLAAAGGVMAFGIVAGARFRNPAAVAFVALAMIAFSLSWLGILYPKDLIREVSMPMALLPFALAGRMAAPYPEASEAAVG